MKADGSVKRNWAFLLSSMEEYGSSSLYGVKQVTMATSTGEEFLKASFGSIRAFWPYNSTATDALVTSSYWNYATVVGTFEGKGIISSIPITNTTAGQDL